MEKKRLKIAFLSFYSGQVYRGVETFVHETANRLADLDHEVTVYQNGPKLPNTRYGVVSAGIKVDWKEKGSYTPFVNYCAKRVKEFTRKSLRQIKNIDILFPTNGQWQSVLCKLWSLGKKVKLVQIGQSGPGIDDRINIWTFPDVFLGMTDEQVRWAKRTNPFVRVEKIPNGVNLGKFNPEVGPLRPGLAELAEPVILNVAAFDSWKRQELAIKAVSKLKKGSLLLVGRGLKEHKLKRLCVKYLTSRFKIMSFRYDQMPSVYASADLFTYPTVTWESFGIVMLEAMASGLPVVATDDPIRREIVGNAGLFVDPTDTEAYAKALQKALDTNWGDKPRRQAEKYSWDKITKRYEELFLDLTK